MNTRTILGVLLAGSVALNILFWYNPGLISGNCDMIAGFEEPESISREQAKEYAENFAGSPAGEEKVYGGIITTSAFLELLCNEKCNGISYTYAKKREDDGSLSGTFVVFTGVEVVEENKTITKINEIANAPFFITRHWCPPTCFAW